MRPDTPAQPGVPAARNDRRGRALLPWAALAVVLVAVLVATVMRSAPDDSPAARTRRLAERLKCPECQGLSVADSNESTSEAIKADIRRRIDEGESDAEILAVYADRYGEQILLRPEGGGLGLLAWGLPVAVVVLGAGGVVLALRRSRRAPPADEGPALKGTLSAGPPSARRRVLVVGGLVAFAVAAGAALALAMGERREGQSITGAVPSTTPVDAYTEHLGSARALLAEDPFEALKEYDAAAGLRPAEPEPRAYGGWCLTILAGQAPEGEERDLFVEGARARLDAALETDDEYPDTYAFYGLLHLEVLADPTAAVPYLQRFLTLTPDGHEFREQVLDALEQAVEGAPPENAAESTTPTTATTTPTTATTTTTATP